MSRMAYVVAAALCAGQAAAQDAQPETIDERQFLAGVGAEHAGVRALGEALARAEAARSRATLFANPRVEFRREQPAESMRQDTWTVAWAPPLDGRRGLARDAAQAGLEAARERTTFERLRLFRELRRAYAEWSLAEERSALLGQQLTQVEDLARQARQRAQVGEESGLAARRLELAAAEVVAQLATARTARTRAEAMALAWRPDVMGRRPVLPELPAPPARLDPEQRADVRALRLEVRQADLESRLAGRFWTFPDLQAGVQRLDDGGATQSGPVFGFAWSVPLLDRNQPARIDARRRKEVAEARLALSLARAQYEATSLLDAYGTATDAATRAVRETADARRLVEAATASYRAGEATLTDLLETLRAVREARLRALDLQGEALELHREMATWTSATAEGEQR